MPAHDSFARLLGPWGVPPVAPAPLAERLGGWLGWADAILLSQALAAPAASAAPAPGAGNARAALDWATAALDRLQTELGTGFADPELAAESAQPLPDAAVPLADLLAPYRLHHAQQQRGMAAKVASLRERLRGRLAALSPRLAQLAALDAVFDRALAAPAHQQLAGLPALLTRRAEGHLAADPRHWRARLWADLQRLLHAELDLRLQPVQGLIEALHAD
jgi:hypothetical protein